MTVLDEKIRQLEVDALTSADVNSYKVDCKDLYSTYFYVDLLDEDGSFIMRQVEMQVPPQKKHFDCVTVRTDRSARDLEENAVIKTVYDIR